MSEVELTPIDVAINLMLMEELLPQVKEDMRNIGRYLEDCIQKIALKYVDFSV